MGDAPFDILFQDDSLVAIHKPPGFHVHQPEFPRRRVSREVVCLNRLRDQLGGVYLYPVHRIDVATEGVLLFALDKESAAHLSRNFRGSEIKKTYFALARGWLHDEGMIEIPLELDSTGEPVDARTHYQTVARFEIDQAVGKRHPSARYSLVRALPETGRYHQIRRHLARLSHPIVGDREHGDSRHNRFFREHLNLGGLWLNAKAIEFPHPKTLKFVRIRSPWSPRWQAMFKHFSLVCPQEEDHD